MTRRGEKADAHMEALMSWKNKTSYGVREGGMGGRVFRLDLELVVGGASLH